MTCPRNIARVLRISGAYFLYGIAALATQAGIAQDHAARIVGRVTASDTQRPLEQAHVFIAFSMIGTTTNAAGQFELAGVPPGAHHLHVSMVGYTPFERDSLFRAGTSYSFDVQLQPTTIELEEVTVSAREARRWQRRLLKFGRLFLGETGNSDLASFKNPEVLSFTSKSGKFSATASAPLIIENRALGYQLTYYLKEFFYSGNTLKYDGDPVFIELVPADSVEAALWEANRQAAFYGSQRHYFLALLDQRAEQEGFITYRRFRLDRGASFLVDESALLRAGPTSFEKELTFTGYLEIVYTREKEDALFRRWRQDSSGWQLGDQRSYIKLNDGPTLIDQSGEVIDPYGITVYGYFAFERFGDLLPKEYRPPE